MRCLPVPRTSSGPQTRWRPRSRARCSCRSGHWPVRSSPRRWSMRSFPSSRPAPVPRRWRCCWRSARLPPTRWARGASAAADRLVEAGLPRPGWAGELGQPVTTDECWRLSDPAGTGSMLACAFHRAGRSHAVVVSVDHLDCGAATDMLLLEADQLPQALEMMRSQARAGGVEVTEEPLDPPELRWQIENALDARAVHDSDGGERDTDELPIDDEDGLPGYPALAALLRARMRTLPAPTKAPAAHADQDDQDDQDGPTPRQMRALPARGGRAGLGPAPTLSAAGRRPAPSRRNAPSPTSRRRSTSSRWACAAQPHRSGGVLRCPPIPASPGCIASSRPRLPGTTATCTSSRPPTASSASPTPNSAIVPRRRSRWNRSPPPRAARSDTPTTSATTGNTTSWWRRFSTGTARSAIHAAPADDAPPRRRTAAASGATPTSPKP